MLSLLSVLRMDRFTPRFYIAAATDNMSLHKARSFEDSLADKVYIHTLYVFGNMRAICILCGWLMMRQTDLAIYV